MKKVLVILFALVLNIIAYAQKDVSYNHKPFTAESCSVQYYVGNENNIFYIYVSVQSERLVFPADPSMKVRTFGGDVLDIPGENISQQTSTGGIVIGNTIVPYTALNALARFAITEQQFEQLSHGVKKVRLNTVPIYHEKEFKKDKIGATLYKMYQNQKDKDF